MKKGSDKMIIDTNLFKSNFLFLIFSFAHVVYTNVKTQNYYDKICHQNYAFKTKKNLVIYV